MSLCGYTLDDLGVRLSCRALINFIRHLPCTSATCKALNPSMIEDINWSSDMYVAQLLAGISDHLASLNYSYARVHSKRGKSLHPPKPIPRPGIKDKEKVSYGKDPIPISQFEEWWNEGGE